MSLYKNFNGSSILLANDLFNSFMTGPDEKGRFGQFGGRFVSETLMPLILELEDQ